MPSRRTPGKLALWRCGSACALVIAAFLALNGAALRAQTPALPPMVGASEAALKERAALFAELKSAKNEADAREIEQKIWKFWLTFADEQTRAMA